MKNEIFMRFQGGKAKALTLSYDDGVVADARLLDIMTKRGLKGAFNLNSGLFDDRGIHNRMNESEAFALFKGCGQEIALHGRDHIFLTEVNDSCGIDEVFSNRLYLENKYGTIVSGMAYAYGAYNNRIKNYLRFLGVDYARTTHSTYSFELPEDWLELNPTCHHNDIHLSKLTEEFIRQDPSTETKRRRPLLFYLWGHSYEFDDLGNWYIIESFAETMQKESSIWHCTGIELYHYVKAYESLVFSADGKKVFNPSCQTVWFDYERNVYEIASGKIFDLNKKLVIK